jgi:hypothetical protein
MNATRFFARAARLPAVGPLPSTSHHRQRNLRRSSKRRWPQVLWTRPVSICKKLVTGPKNSVCYKSIPIQTVHSVPALIWPWFIKPCLKRGRKKPRAMNHPNGHIWCRVCDNPIVELMANVRRHAQGHVRQRPDGCTKDRCKKETDECVCRQTFNICYPKYVGLYGNTFINR